MSKVVLFDMDGTLTPPREKMNSNILKPLSELQKNGFEIAIVSGSDLDYIEEQCEILWDINNVDPYKIHFLPCNGTKYFLSDSSGFGVNCFFEGSIALGNISTFLLLDPTNM